MPNGQNGAYSPNTYWPPPGTINEHAMQQEKEVQEVQQQAVNDPRISPMYEATPQHKQPDQRVYPQYQQMIPAQPQHPNLPLGTPPPGVTTPPESKIPWTWIGGGVLVVGAGYGLWKLLGGWAGVKTVMADKVTKKTGFSPPVRTNPDEDEYEDEDEWEDDEEDDEDEE